MLSAIAIALLNPIASANVRFALLNYINHRVNLKESVDQIKTDPCWQALVEERGEPNNADNLKVEELLKFECKEDQIPNNKLQPTKTSIRATGKIPTPQNRLVWDMPEPPTDKFAPANPARNLQIVFTYPLPSLVEIAKTLAQLDDVKLLMSARRYSPKFNGLIYRWQMVRHRAERKNSSSDDTSLAGFPQAVTLQSMQLPPAVLQLSLADIKLLADVHLPDPSLYEDIRSGEPRVQIPAMPFQIQLEAGSILVTFGILLAVMYFWLFYREARTSTSYPAAGTLFGAFDRTRSSRGILLALLLVPAVSSVVLSTWTKTHSASTYVNVTVISSVLTVLFTVDIIRLSFPSYVYALSVSFQEISLEADARFKLRHRFGLFIDFGLKLLIRTFGDQWRRILLVVFLISASTIGMAVSNWTRLRELPFVSWLVQKPLPKADSKRFTVAIAHFGNDQDSKYESLIATAIKDLEGIQVILIDRKISLSGQRTQGELVSAGKKKAREFLHEAGAQAVIWGQRIDFDGNDIFRVFWTTQTESGKSIRSYNLHDFRLPDLSFSELNDIIRLIVFTQDGLMYKRLAILGPQIVPLIDRIKRYLNETANDPRRRSSARTHVKFTLAHFLGSLGSQIGQNHLLEDSVTIHRELLHELNEAHDQRNRSAVQSNLGNVLRRLGEQEQGTGRLKEALAAQTAARKDRIREKEPIEWAKITESIGSVLQSLGARETSTKRLREAVTLHRTVLEEQKRGGTPNDWVRAQINLSAALLNLGDRETGTAYFEESIALLQVVLKELNRESDPMAWANIHDNLGTALQYVGQRTSNMKPLEKSIVAHREALKEWTRQRVPLNWALAQNNLGTALRRLGELESQTERLQEAVAAHRDALKEWTRERVPLSWAVAQNNLGTALRRLGEVESNRHTLDEAVDAHRQALKVWTRELMPVQWGEGQEQLDQAQKPLRSRTPGVAMEKSSR